MKMYKDLQKAQALIKVSCRVTKKNCENFKRPGV